jgi:hypothetical protein
MNETLPFHDKMQHLTQTLKTAIFIQEWIRTSGQVEEVLPYKGVPDIEGAVPQA